MVKLVAYGANSATNQQPIVRQVMATASKTKKKAAPKKAAAKKTAPKKKAPAVTKLPDIPVDAAKVLPRGQERLPCGTVRLKTGDHDLGKDSQTYDVHGAKLDLKGRILVASKNCNWLAITKCQKCNTERSTGPLISALGEHTVVTYMCDNEAECQLGGRLYVAVYSKSKLGVSV